MLKSLIHCGSFLKSSQLLLSRKLLMIVGVIISLGLAVLAVVLVGAYIQVEPKNDTRSGSVAGVSASSTSGGKTIDFGTHAPRPTLLPAPAPARGPNLARRSPPSASCSGSRNTPGGPDPWGSCWPGPNNTGVPAGTNLVNVDMGTVNHPNSRLAADNKGWKYSAIDRQINVTAPGAVMDGIKDTNGVYIPSGYSLTVKNSHLGVINDNGSSLLVENSVIDGGAQTTYPTVGGQNVTVLNSNLYGGKDGVNCEGDNCTVKDSWLHDNYPAPSNGAHQQGFFANGNLNDTLQHNSISCRGNCTADISLMNGYPTSNVKVLNNLLVASTQLAFCAYPGPDSDPLAQPVNYVLWKDNVFQKGANGKCGYWGAVYAWFPKLGTGNVWSGNTWEDRTLLTP